MNLYLFIHFPERTQTDPYLIYAESAQKAFKEFMEHSKMNIDQVQEALENEALLLYSPISEQNPCPPQMDIQEIIENMDLELFLSDPNKRIREILKSSGYNSEEFQFYNPDTGINDVSIMIFNFLVNYLLRNRPDSDKYLLRIPIDTNLKRIYLPYLAKDKDFEMGNHGVNPSIDLLYALDFNSFISILIEYK